ncbi:leukocyte receptor cluster member 1 [Protopterus annectens]|uniref:leukocyte receptor cluster member 1 n=1 Tax=Protopterus annectens TaxID=7888 RepID=UPI001CFA8FC1|nr:leukocyte receptor cluster member 1 [Protopterus annectens]
MNILPKKSWHVRNKDNIARVRKDEALAAEQERERKRRLELAEQEARTEYLRKKAHLTVSESGSGSSAVAIRDSESHHLNFFTDLEDGKGTKAGNREYEDEKRQEKERREKALGILTYLGQSAAEAQTSRPWYEEVPDRSKKTKEENSRKETKDTKLKCVLDPLVDMEKYLQKKRGEKSKHRHHKKDKEKIEKKEDCGSKVSIDMLRAERLKREAAERARAEALLARARGEETSDAATELDDRKRRYNSQFNPELARKPRPQDQATWR